MSLLLKHLVEADLSSKKAYKTMKEIKSVCGCVNWPQTSLSTHAE